MEIQSFFGAPQAENSPIRKVAGASNVDHSSRSTRRSNVTNLPGPSTSQRCGFSARTPSWSSETLEIHWKTKGKPACAPGLSQAPWRFPAIGNSTPRRRCIAMRGAHANSPEPYSGSHSSRCLRMHKKWRENSAFYRSHTDVDLGFVFLRFLHRFP